MQPTIHARQSFKFVIFRFHLFFSPCLNLIIRRGSLLLTLHKKIKKISEVTTPTTKNAKPIFEFKSTSIDGDNKQVNKMQNILACQIFWLPIWAFSRSPLGISMPYALWHCCLLCWGVQVTIYFDKSIVFMLIVPSWRWPSGGAHSIDLTRGSVPSKHCNWCPSVKISCLRDFWYHLLLFHLLLLLLLFVTEKRTNSRPADWKVQLGYFRILNCTFTPLSWLWIFYWTSQQKIQKPLFVSFSTCWFFRKIWLLYTTVHLLTSARRQKIGHTIHLSFSSDQPNSDHIVHP